MAPMRTIGLQIERCFGLLDVRFVTGVLAKMKPLSAFSWRLALLLLVACFSGLAESQNCGKQARGALCSSRSACCSQWGFCGTTAEHCGAGCQSGFCTRGSPPPRPGQGLRRIFPRERFAAWFPNRNPFYRYDALMAAADSYPSFANKGSDTAQKREVAAFFAHVKHETGGLQFIEEHNKSPSYCRTGDNYGCAPGKKYYGRGPLQLSWNYNYKLASPSVKYNIWADPDRVAVDATLAFKTALWFWLTPSGNKPSCHSVIVANGGFGTTTNIINGGLECGPRNPEASAQARARYYEDFCRRLSVDPGPNRGCRNLQPYA